MSTARPGSSAGRPGTSQRGVVPQGTATRLTTAAPGTARPGTRGGVVGGGVALSSQLNVSERPVTQQGLGGPKTAHARGPQRQVQDKTYFLGLLRNKINDLNSETTRLRRETETISEDQSTYVQYEKRAEQLAQELKELQGELSDYNTLVDHINTDSSVTSMQIEYSEKKAQNDREASSLDTLFEQKQQKESVIRELEQELKQQRNLTETMIADMSGDMRRKYSDMKEKNERFLREIEEYQQELDRLGLKQADLEQELNMSPVKQEAVRLQEQLHDAEQKRDEIAREMETRGTPQEEREKLLQQVKDNNADIDRMEKQTKELEERLLQAQEELQGLETDLEDNSGEKNQKYRDLKKKEELMDDFMKNFQDNRSQEQVKMKELQSKNVQLLEKISRSMARSGQLPTADELNAMQEDLAIKRTEKDKAESTVSGLALERAKLRDDLIKIEQLETKVKEERIQLQEKIERMQIEMDTYTDLDRLKEEAEDRKRQLSDDKVVLHRRREVLKSLMQQLSLRYESLKKQLQSNEMYTQLNNLEKKWQQQEQNNFAASEFISAKTKDTDYRQTARRVTSLLTKYNNELIERSGGRIGSGHRP